MGTGFMKSLEYAWYDFNSIGESIKTRKIYGYEPKIEKDADAAYGYFTEQTDGGKLYERKTFKGLDRAVFVIDRINELKKDIERYRAIGEVRDRIDPTTKEPVYFDFRRLIPAVEKEIEELYEYL